MGGEGGGGEGGGGGGGGEEEEKEEEKREEEKSNNPNLKGGEQCMLKFAAITLETGCRDPQACQIAVSGTKNYRVQCFACVRAAGNACIDW